MNVSVASPCVSHVAESATDLVVVVVVGILRVWVACIEVLALVVGMTQGVDTMTVVPSLPVVVVAGVESIVVVVVQ